MVQQVELLDTLVRFSCGQVEAETANSKQKSIETMISNIQLWLDDNHDLCSGDRGTTEFGLTLQRML